MIVDVREARTSLETQRKWPWKWSRAPSTWAYTSVKTSPGGANTSSLGKKDHCRLHFLRKLRYAGLREPVLTAFYRCVVKTSSAPPSDPISHDSLSLWSSKITTPMPQIWIRVRHFIVITFISAYWPFIH